MSMMGYTDEDREKLHELMKLILEPFEKLAKATNDLLESMAQYFHGNDEESNERQKIRSGAKFEAIKSIEPTVKYKPPHVNHNYRPRSRL